MSYYFSDLFASNLKKCNRTTRDKIIFAVYNNKIFNWIIN